MEELKPCPICGSTNLAMSRCVCTNMDHEFIPDTVHMHVFDLYCKECGCRVQAGGDTFDEAKNAVVEKWNNRDERTCRVVVKELKFSQCQTLVTKSCSSCGYVFGDEEVRPVLPGLDETMVINEVVVPHYCPNCGAKVIG